MRRTLQARGVASEDVAQWIATPGWRPAAVDQTPVCCIIMTSGSAACSHTSPIYIADGEWWLFDQDAAQYMLTLIDGGWRTSGKQLTITHPAQ